jgi:hypothetical protein
MSNSKISALTSATTPLAGTETLPVVQSSTTKQVSVANLTAGRAISAASLALTTPLPASSGGTGLSALGTGVATWLGTPSSANLAAAVTDETGSGSLVFGTSPTMITPTIGPSGNFTDSYLTITQSGFSTGGQSYQVFKDANGVTGAINSWGSAYGGAYSLGIALSSNMVNNGSLGGTLQYGQTGVSTMYKQYNGSHYFYRAASGSGGSNISYQEVLSTDTSNNITFTAGNLVQGTAAKGINFTANTPAAGMTSQLLNWYEEGTWTPTAIPGAGAITTYASGGTYTRVGRQVTVTAYVDLTNVGTASGTLQISNLPFKNGAMSGAGYLQQMGVVRETGPTGVIYVCVIGGGSPFTSIYILSLTGGPIVWANTYQYALSITYYTA